MENSFSQVNPELFKEEAPKELIAQTYYAYIDSIERAYGMTYLRFDCIIKRQADSIDITDETIVGLPSIVIDVSGANELINELFKINGNFTIYNYESKWVVITTSLNQSDISVSEFFNFVQVGEQGLSNTYTIENLAKNDDLDQVSRLKINQIIKATTLKESDKDEVITFLAQIQLDPFSHVNVYNVGQGNCNALVDSSNLPLLYFDVGGGSGANSHTYPANFKLCHSNHPKVILSHWHLDHIIAAVYDPKLLKTKWLAPVHESLSNTAIQIVSALQRNKNLICWNASLGNLVPFGNHFIAKCNATSTNKNSSGLSLYMNYKNKDYVLLPGDATFGYLPPLNFKHKLIGLVASHHGAKSSIGGMPMASPPGMLAYSFGNGNIHGHAHRFARTEYKRFGWGNGLDTVNGNIGLIQSPSCLNVPCNLKGCSLSIIQNF